MNKLSNTIRERTNRLFCVFLEKDTFLRSINICEHDLSQQTLKPVVNNFCHH